MSSPVPPYADSTDSLPPFAPSAETPPEPPRFQHRYQVHLLWLLATVVMTTLIGAEHYAAFLSRFGQEAVPTTLPLLLGGLWYSGTIIAILGAHEMGHYVMCRAHKVDATLPYFIPAPFFFGTLGAVIKIREPFRSKNALFDIGVGGPLAGFAVLVPALVIGVAMSTIERLPEGFEGISLGEPLLFRLTSWVVWGPLAAHQSLNLHPMGLAAWLGLLATALNLIPFGQLDGGHLAYAVFGPRATAISLASVLGVVGMTLASWSWLFFALLLVGMLVVMGPRHPRVPDEYVPLDRTRRRIALAAAIIFLLCFTPAPIEPYQLIQNP